MKLNQCTFRLPFLEQRMKWVQNMRYYMSILNDLKFVNKINVVIIKLYTPNYSLLIEAPTFRRIIYCKTIHNNI